mgnify:FL=1
MIDLQNFQADFIAGLDVATQTQDKIDSGDVALLLRYYKQLMEDYKKAEEQRAYASMALQRVEDDYIQLRTEHMTPEEYQEAYAGMDEPSGARIIAEFGDVLEKQRKSLEGLPPQRMIFDDGIDPYMDSEE